MNPPENVDQYAVMRARAMLLGSGRPSYRQEVEACRVLAKVSPLTYLPRLVRALLMLSYQPEFRDRPQECLAVCEESLAAARLVEAGEPKRLELLADALNACQRELYRLGRREDGFAVREEMAGVGRQAYESGQVASPVYGLGPLAAALAEEGRHSEAADAYGRIVEAERAKDGKHRVRDWSLINWAAALDAAGQHDAALAAFGELVMATRNEFEAGTTSLSILAWELMRFSEMLDAHGQHADACAVRLEVGVLLAELARTGERKSWSNITAWWVVLLGLSGRSDERPAPGEPAPPFGSHMGWSPDLRVSYLEGRSAIEAAIASLAPLAQDDPHRYLAELVTLQRRLTIRSAIHWQWRTHRILEPLQPMFDQGVTLARRLLKVDADQGRATLARALTDRSMLFVAGRQYAEAHADFQEAAANRNA